MSLYTSREEVSGVLATVAVKMLKEKRDNMDRNIKEARENLDMKLKHEREEMDRQIVFERIITDSEIMQARVEMDNKLQHEREYADLQIMQEQKPITDKKQKGIISPPEEKIQEPVTNYMPTDMHIQEQKPTTDMVKNEIIPDDMHLEEELGKPIIVMEFRVHVVGEGFFADPQGYDVGLPYIFRFMEPAIVDWSMLQDHMGNAGLRLSADLYYLDPSREAPDSLVRMTGPGDMDDLSQAHLGTQLCHLYIVDDQYWADSDGGMDVSD